MTEAKPTRTVRRRGRIFPEIIWSSEQIARWEAETEALYQRCQLIFDRLQTELIKTHYNWYIAIEPDSESYILDKDETAILQKVRQSYPNSKTFLFQINETGAFGTI